MTQPAFKKTALIFIFSIVSFLIYLYSFCNEFGFHNDYSMLLWEKNTLLGFIESKHAFMIGRALGAALVTFQCWALHKISDFAFWRLMSFFVMLISIICIIRFLQKRCRLDFFWAVVIAFSILLLPVSQMCILWSAHFMPGAVNILLSILCYFLLDKTAKEKMSFAMIFPFLLFVASLFIYPPTSLFVFVFTFYLVMCAPVEEWKKTKRVVLRDILFFGMGMFVYRVIDRLILFPWGLETAHFPIPTQPEYHMGITLDFLSKWPLLKSTFLISAGGTWHLLFAEKGAFIFLGTIMVLGAIILCWNIKNHKQSKYLCVHGIKVFLIIVVLFLLVNLPELLAKANFTVLGYRVLFPSSVMLLFLPYWLMMRCQPFWEQKFKFPVMKTLALIFILGAALLTVRNVKDVVRNYTGELQFIRREMAVVDPQRVSRYLVIKIPEGKGKTLIERPLPMEFSYMITCIQHVVPIIREALNNQGNRNAVVQLLDPQYTNFIRFIKFEKGDYLIDLNKAISH